MELHSRKVKTESRWRHKTKSLVISTYRALVLLETAEETQTPTTLIKEISRPSVRTNIPKTSQNVECTESDFKKILTDSGCSSCCYIILVHYADHHQTIFPKHSNLVTSCDTFSYVPPENGTCWSLQTFTTCQWGTVISGSISAAVPDVETVIFFITWYLHRSHTGISPFHCPW